ncbi:MAG: type II secretion system protein GspL [Desulfatibacillaceae bacterium]
MPEKRLGLEIQHDAVIAVCANVGLKGSQVLAWSRADVEEDEGVDEALDRALDDLAKRCDLTQAVCTVSLDPTEVSFRNVTLPFTEARKLRQALPFELEAHLPHRAEEVVVDYHVVRRGDRTECVTVAAPIDLIRRKLDLMGRHGWDPESLAVGGFPAALAFVSDVKPDYPGIFLYAAPKSALMVLFAEGRILTVRNLRVPASNPYPRLAREAMLLVNAYNETREEPVEPRRMVVTGSGLDGEEAETALAEQLGMPVSHVDLAAASRVEMEENGGVAWNSDVFDPTLALAVHEPGKNQGFNLRQGPFAPTRRWEQYRQDVFRIAGLALVVLVALLGRYMVDLHLLDQKEERLKQQIAAHFIAAMPDVSGEVRDPVARVRSAIAEMQQTRVLPEDQARSVAVADMLRAVSEQVPRATQAEFNTFVVSDDGVQIAGETNDFNSVNQIRSALERVPYFRRVELVSSGKSQDGETVRFKIKAGLRTDQEQAAEEEPL